jgi:hypothetical protein
MHSAGPPTGWIASATSGGAFFDVVDEYLKEEAPQ